MEGLSSSDTKYLLQTLSELPKEIARLNSISTNSSGGDTVVASKVFGWRHSFWLPKAHSDSSSLPHNNEDTLLIWKATKTFESTDMRPLAKKIWNSTETFSRVSESSKITTWEVLHSINKHARVIRRVDHMHGREEQETIWLECFLDRGNHICIGRKQLRQFRGYQLEAHPTSDLAATDKGAGENLTTGHECEGFLFRPHLTKLKDEYMLGSTLQCISSVAPRGKSSTECLLKHIVDDLPRFTLQWEEALVHDLLPQIRY
uniref:Uncharacterized protein n=1 Tax=Globisporangium ultimum (strain ATCC 200006 / CBS 805.95 / DAOM BR144) TaxID=431595 RepID=K3WCX3_GLOUD